MTIAQSLQLYVALGLAFVAGISPGAAQEAFDTVDHAVLYDVGSGTVLFQKDADEPMPPASLAKLMTMAIVFEALRNGTLSLDDEFVISENAWRKGGAPSGTSTMFAELGSSIALRDLIRGVIIQSGNDAAIAIAEGIAGDEAAFAERMNEMAGELGLTGSVFVNSTGLPDPAQHVTASDLATLAAYIITEFPDYYAIYGERNFTWNGITQSNRNPLLDMDIGADGMKTGFTEESGYGLVGSAIRDGRRLIVVIGGANSDNERGEQAAALLEWGFTAFTTVTLFSAGAVIAEADVFGGAAASVPLILAEPITVLVPEASIPRLSAEIAYQGPIPAPVAAGQQAGQVRVMLDGESLTTRPLTAGEAVPSGNLPQRARDGLVDLLFGWR